MKIIEDLTPKLRELEAKDIADPRPWYEKHWPYMRHCQRVKVISARCSSGPLVGKENIVRTIAAKWIRRLSPTVNYDMRKKLFVFEETVGYDVPAGETETFALVRCYTDQSGEPLPFESQCERVGRGDYFLVCIELFTSNWPGISPSILEENILHELLHVVRPSIGLYRKNGALCEDEDFVSDTTKKLIKEFRQLGKSGRAALLEMQTNKPHTGE